MIFKLATSLEPYRNSLRLLGFPLNVRKLSFEFCLCHQHAWMHWVIRKHVNNKNTQLTCLLCVLDTLHLHLILNNFNTSIYIVPFYKWINRNTERLNESLAKSHIANNSKIWDLNLQKANSDSLSPIHNFPGEVQWNAYKRVRSTGGWVDLI